MKVNSNVTYTIAREGENMGLSAKAKEYLRDYNSYKTTGGRNRNYRNLDILTFTNNRKGESISISVSSIPNMEETVLDDAIAPGLVNKDNSIYGRIK